MEAVHGRLGDTLTDARILRALDEIEEAEDDPVALAERLTLPERDLADARPDVFAFLTFGPMGQFRQIV